MPDKNERPLSPIAAWAAIGACCGPAAAILTVVIVFSRTNPGDDPGRDGGQAMILMIASIVVLIPVGAILGVIVGTILAFIRRRRNQQERLRIAANTGWPQRGCAAAFPVVSAHKP